MQNVKIRYARMSDFKDILKLSKSAWSTWWSSNYKYGIEYTVRCIKNKTTLVAVLNKELVGYLIFSSVWSRHLRLEDVSVKTKYRKLGIASMLMKSMIDNAKKKGIRKIIAEVDTYNKASYKYHLKNGFKKSGFIKSLWGNTDAFVFIKDLRSSE